MYVVTFLVRRDYGADKVQLRSLDKFYWDSKERKKPIILSLLTITIVIISGILSTGLCSSIIQR